MERKSYLWLSIAYEAPTEGYEDAIVVPEINANNFEIKHGLLNLVQNKQFFGHDKEDPHAHIRYFNKINSTMKFPNVPSTSQRFDESFYEAWDRFNDLLRECPHHGFSELHQLDTFYNALNSNDQDSLNSAAGVMNRDTEVTKDTMLPTNNGSTEDVQPPVVQVQSQNPTSEPVVDPVSAPRPNQQTSIPFPSRRNDERRREKANDQIEKF
ncbi:hypothetical protein Tco_1282049 [Tanacetum coccineum]